MGLIIRVAMIIGLVKLLVVTESPWPFRGHLTHLPAVARGRSLQASQAEHGWRAWSRDEGGGAES